MGKDALEAFALIGLIAFAKHEKIAIPPWGE
jgi:hypothetical protein